MGIRKTNVSESLWTCRYGLGGIETGVSFWLRDESGGCPISGQAVSGMEAT